MKVKKVTSWKTSDGKFFDHQREAEEHEMLTAIEAICKDMSIEVDGFRPCVDVLARAIYKERERLAGVFAYRYGRETKESGFENFLGELP